MVSKGFVPLAERMEEDEIEENMPTEAKVVNLLNEAQLGGKEKKTLSCLHQVKELIMKKDPNLLDSFLEEVIAFQREQSADVRKFIVAFMEDACKSDSGMLVRVIPMLSYMMDDVSVNVIKRLLTCVLQLYKIALIHISKLKVVDSEVQDMWESLQDIKSRVCDLSEADNDGIRTMAIKFMEVLILCQTRKDPDSEPVKGQEEVSLDIVPADHALLKPAELREEAGTTVGTLLSLITSSTISSVNLMTAIGCLASIAKQRSKYISTVLQSFEHLHANLPPNFATSQITSVRKQLKTQLLGLLKLPSSYESRDQLATLLTDLGCTQAEINKSIPKGTTEALKRVRALKMMEEDGTSVTKSRLPTPHGAGRPGTGSEAGDKTTSGTALMEAVEITATALKPVLTAETVTELVMASMKFVPEKLPKAFRSSYTPIAAAGTELQVTHLARLIASQMTTVGMGVGAKTKGIKPQQRQHSRSPSPLRSNVPRDPRRGREEGGRARRRTMDSQDEERIPDLESSMRELKVLGDLLGMPNVFDPSFPMAYSTFFGDRDNSIKMDTSSLSSPNVVEMCTSPVKEDVKPIIKKEKRKSTAVAPQKLKKIKLFDLSSVVKPLSAESRREMSIETFKRILEADCSLCHGSGGQARTQLIISLVMQFGGDFNAALLEFILNDIRSHIDLAIAWLFAEYSISEGYFHHAQDLVPYDDCLMGLLLGSKDKLGPKDRLFTRLVVEAPRVSEPAFDLIKSYCKDEERVFLGLATLEELVTKRPRGPDGTDDFLQALLDVTTSKIELARFKALYFAKKFYTKKELSMKIEKYALHQLQYLLSDHPPFVQDVSSDGIGLAPIDWSEETVKLCMGLFLSLLPLNHKLLKDLAFVYTGTSATVKKIIHAHLDQPLSMIGMDSPELLELVESCPVGGETLIVRMLHILTESSPPSPELVQRVRELYHKNSSDVRFLIPVLHGLKKQEVIDALPQFIRLSPGLVKNVFERLLLSYSGEQGKSISPITPSELLVSLHNIDCSTDESLMKAVVKATNVCFQEKAVFSQEVLAVVLQQLLEQTPVPTLFMRTVLQSLGICPKLVNFVITILVKLITKQVWKQPKVWQGFIRCCEVTKPYSFPVMLQLPLPQLENIFKVKPVLRESIIKHVKSLTPHQRAVVPRSVLNLLEGQSVKAEEEIKQKQTIE